MRDQLVAAATRALAIMPGRADILGVACLMGSSRTLVWKITTGQRRLTDEYAERLANGLRDHARRCEALASLIDDEVRGDSSPGMRDDRPRGHAGRFEVRG